MKKGFFAFALAFTTVACSNEAATTETSTTDTTVVSQDTTVVTEVEVEGTEAAAE